MPKSENKRNENSSANGPAAGNGKPLVIVESPTKAKTIGKFLGGQYLIEASRGHIRDLPQNKSELPAKFKDKPWAYLAVDVEHDFEPVYIVPQEKKDQVKKLRGLLQEASELYLATDEDREGEAISWHLREVLNPKVPVRRMVFHEITQQAIRQAMANPRTIDQHLVHAQEARRILDRLYGYDLSQMLRGVLPPNQKYTAGRVQSVALRLLVDRERERIAFRSATYWDLLGTFAKETKQTLQATLISADGRRVPSAKDFDSSTGKIKDANLLLLNEQQVEELRQRLEGADFKVANVDDKPYTSKPYEPFTTNSLLQEANRKLRFNTDRTMRIAQQLYENGHITYMRTDSTVLSEEAISAARNLVLSHYGQDYLPAQPRLYRTKVKNAQEAHEAIRPAMQFTLPEDLRSQLTDEQARLYDLIWKRTIASQMTDARGRRISIVIAGGGAEFQVGGKTIDFPGYLRAYVEGTDDPEAELADKETILPSVIVGEPLDCQKLESKSHTTQPPPRYTESTLVKTLEQRGIGRPSTYAAIIGIILDTQRAYGFLRGSALVPTWKAFVLVRLMENHFPDLVDYEFTARMLEDLDAISRGETNYSRYLHHFYWGEDNPGLKKRLEEKVNQIDAEEVKCFHLGKPEEGDEIILRVGAKGPYLSQGERRVDVPGELPPDELTLEKATTLLEQASLGEEPLGMDPESHKPVYVKVGRFGPYVQLGESDDKERKTSSLLKGMQPEDIDMPVALKLLSLPRELGPHPESGDPIMAATGRYGPFIRCGSETRSLPDELPPTEVTREQALDLLSKPKPSRKRSFGAKKEPLRTLGASPDTGEQIQLLEGRYGPYVTDGSTNASLPRDVSPDDITLEEAAGLIRARAAAGGTKKKTKKKAATKKSAKKETTAKRTTKKTTKKKSS